MFYAVLVNVELQLLSGNSIVSTSVIEADEARHIEFLWSGKKQCTISGSVLKAFYFLVALKTSLAFRRLL